MERSEATVFFWEKPWVFGCYSFFWFFFLFCGCCGGLILLVVLVVVVVCFSFLLL